MSMFSSFGLLGLFSLPVLLCQWIGVIGLRKSARKMDCWLMMIGTVLVTFGTLAPFIYFLPAFNGSSNLQSMTNLFMGIAALSGLGSLSFAIGFMLHGTRGFRITQRITELEMMNLAQATELERLRNR